MIDDEPEGGLALQARYCDLVVVSQSDLDEPGFGFYSDLPAYVMLNSSRPVLIVPYAGQFEQVGQQHAMVAWDGSMQATRAITSALPLLRRAKKVTVVLFNRSSSSQGHGEQPGADIALYLTRHGVNVELLQDHTEIDIGNALLSLAADQRADLLVMGGYGHNRFREILLGGVTMTSRIARLRRGDCWRRAQASHGFS
jgi:nucleotide-binding universal stress UspA family protein